MTGSSIYQAKSFSLCHSNSIFCSKDTIAVQGTETHGHGLPFLTELQRGRKKSHDPFASSTTFTNPLVTEEFPSSSASVGEEIIDTDRMRHDGALKTGVLSKTTIGRREGSRSGPTRHRHFRLTEVALEYLHHFSHVSQRHQQQKCISYS